jgi:phosphoribosyl 1,2-cyclic phosphodiesterase
MVRVTVLGSGSAGNAVLVRAGEASVLLDAGLSARQLAVRLEACGVEPGSLSGILLTHEHSDHAQGLPVFCRKHRVPVYTNGATAAALRDGGGLEGIAWKLFQTGSECEVGGMVFQSFSVPHDAADPVGFVLRSNGASLAYLTDLGFATKLVRERVRGVHTLLIETNHDERLLQEDTRRPWSVKQRILSRHGHLSNASAAEVVADLCAEGLRRAILCHLSRDCNRPDLAEEAVRTRAGGQLEVFAASQGAPAPDCIVG